MEPALESKKYYKAKKLYNLYDSNGTKLLEDCDSIEYGEGYVIVFRDGYLTILDEDLNTVF